MPHLRSRRLAALVLWVAATVASPAGARALVPDGPWPDPERAEAIKPDTITLPSSDPFTPAAIGRAPARAVAAQLWMPANASAAHPVPAVVLLHGSVGNWAERGMRYGAPLAALGVAVLEPDTYASRPDLGRSFIGRALHITETMFDADAYAALRVLAADPRIDSRHIALIGFSYGGMATEYAMYRTIADRLVPPDGPHFVAHVAYYAPCIARFADNRTTGAPLLMMYGGRDQLIHPARCAAIADDLRAGGSAVRVVVFPDAVHQWDGELAPRLIGRHLADCAFRVDRDGTVHDASTGLAMIGPITRGLILAACTGSRPWPIGRDDRVNDESNRVLEGFLAGAFAR